MPFIITIAIPLGAELLLVFTAFTPLLPELTVSVVVVEYADKFIVTVCPASFS